MVDQDVILLLNAYMMQKHQKPMFNSDGKFTGTMPSGVRHSLRQAPERRPRAACAKRLSSYGKGNLYEMKPWINGEWGGLFTWNITIRMFANNMTPPAKSWCWATCDAARTEESGVYFKTSQMFSVAKSTKHPKRRRYC